MHFLNAVEAGNRKKQCRQSKRGFLGINFSQSPRTHSSSAGVLDKARDKGKPGGNGDFNNSHNRQGGKVDDRALME